jgi:acyl-CoA thioesterase I
MRPHFKADAPTRRLAICALMALAIPAIWSEAHAQSVKIVALGASSTNGYGVGRSAAFPAQLEVMLRTRGINATVINEGINGDTTSGMRARLDSAVSAGTRVVILQHVPANNAKRG